MSFSSKQIHTKMALVLFFFLSVQLAGLTCLQDLRAYAFTNDGSASGMAITGDFSSGGSSETSSLPLQQVSNHDCPCHHLVTYLSGTALGAFLYSGELAMSVSTSVRDNFLQAISLPPRFLL
jgi:hypothetical protein